MPKASSQALTWRSMPSSCPVLRCAAASLLDPSPTVLETASISAIARGSLAIQVLRSLGHEVFATCGSDEKCDLAKSLGATGAINYRTSSFSKEIIERTRGRGVDVILDMAGGRYGKENVETLARRDRMSIYPPAMTPNLCPHFARLWPRRQRSQDPYCARYLYTRRRQSHIGCVRLYHP